MFGSLMDDLEFQGSSSKKVTKKTFSQVRNSIHQFILSRFMIYKWIGPFNEMYFKFQQQYKKKDGEIVLLELFDDLFAETYREDSSAKKKKQQIQGSSIIGRAGNEFGKGLPID